MFPLDTHAEVTLDQKHIEGAMQAPYHQPFLLMDLAIVRAKARRLRAALPGVRIHYAVKANPHPTILRELRDQGIYFEVASPSELELLLELNVDPKNVLYSNPVRTRAQLEVVASKGVEWFVIDSLNELEKVFAVRRDAKLFLRLDTPNVGSDWPLVGKFGATFIEALAIIKRAKAIGADLAGAGFHAGSQCRNPMNWIEGLERIRQLFQEMTLHGLTPRFVNIGGGFPVRHTLPIPSIETISAVIAPLLRILSKTSTIAAEPGRFLVADAGCFVCRVMGVAERNGKRWLHLDAGVFGGLFEAFEGIHFRVTSFQLPTDHTPSRRLGEPVPWEVAGPTCDSIDVVMHGAELPANLEEGDFICFHNAGAYTTAYASEFNGFPLPEIRIVDSTP